MQYYHHPQIAMQKRATTHNQVKTCKPIWDRKYRQIVYMLLSVLPTVERRELNFGLFYF